MKNFLRGSLVPFAIVMIWWWGSSVNAWNRFLLPSPQAVFQAAAELSEEGILFSHIQSSLLLVLKGFGAACLLGFPMGVFFGFTPRLLRYANSSLEFIRHIPPIALVPLFILWFGLGNGTKIVTIALAAIFPIFLNTFTALRAIDPQLLEVGSIFRFKLSERFFLIALPGMIPLLLTGVRLGLGYSWRALIGAEILAASSGLGFLILEAEQMGRSDRILLGVIIIGILGSMMDYTLRIGIRRIAPWIE